ncbi:hypothetical protein IEQ34_009211 [Dendrobium chrysotoxum]|uniref:Uncharacterized protein n=1 Tax=Dendrobium chrysotoxum TaxID=161865 RepID=A0AAV7GY22_DENCH|nr:hypothetical protein IEQ34_009211 [Dendrobium chrysotoxum]
MLFRYVETVFASHNYLLYSTLHSQNFVNGVKSSLKCFSMRVEWRPENGDGEVVVCVKHAFEVLIRGVGDVLWIFHLKCMMLYDCQEMNIMHQYKKDLRLKNE